MKAKLKAIFLAAALALAGQAVAGEDSTHRWGAGGTGPAWYQTECGLAGFRGPVPYPDAQRPCSSAKYSAIPDRKSTRLNSSHTVISYAVFCLKKKNKKRINAGKVGI